MGRNHAIHIDGGNRFIAAGPYHGTFRRISRFQRDVQTTGRPRPHRNAFFVQTQGADRNAKLTDSGNIIARRNVSPKAGHADNGNRFCQLHQAAFQRSIGGECPAVAIIPLIAYISNAFLSPKIVFCREDCAFHKRNRICSRFHDNRNIAKKRFLLIAHQGSALRKPILKFLTDGNSGGKRFFHGIDLVRIIGAAVVVNRRKKLCPRIDAIVRKRLDAEIGVGDTRSQIHPAHTVGAVIALVLVRPCLAGIRGNRTLIVHIGNPVIDAQFNGNGKPGSGVQRDALIQRNRVVPHILYDAGSSHRSQFAQ